MVRDCQKPDENVSLLFLCILGGLTPAIATDFISDMVKIVEEVWEFLSRDMSD